MKGYEKPVRELTDFIKKSPTSFHVVDNIRKMLQSSNSIQLFEDEVWELNRGCSYFVTRNQSSIIAFSIPADNSIILQPGFSGNFQIIASHSDSPCFKLKENYEIPREKSYISLNVEKYGGMLLNPWFDRPLSIAGKVCADMDGHIEPVLINFDKDLCMIPSLAIHLDRKANEGRSLQIQKELIPLFAGNSEGKFKKMLSKAAGVKASAITGCDLFLYDRTPASIWGANGEFFSSSRLDDLMCAHSSVKAFLSSSNPKSITMCCIFDNEEVGSLTKQGADSTFLSDTIERICCCLSLNRQQQMAMISKSFMLSADNGHAVHPNYPEKSDPTNRPVLNGGVLLKYNGNQRYTTDSVSASIFKALCRHYRIPYQTYFNNSDLPGGSTLGNLSSAHVSLNTVDIGAPQLAMHSPYETAGVKDVTYLINAMKAFYSTYIQRENDECYSLSFCEEK